MFSPRFLLLATGFAFLVLAFFASQFSYFGWDLSFSIWLQQFDSLGFHWLMVGTSVPGNGWHAWWLSGAVGIGLALLDRPIESAFCMGAVSSGATISSLLKRIVARPRPSEDLVQVLQDFSNPSFPSGHVSFYVLLFGFICFIGLIYAGSFRQRQFLFWICALPIALVGISRIYLGAHWLSDVVGGYFLGGLWLYGSVSICRRYLLQSMNLPGQLHPPGRFATLGGN